MQIFLENIAFNHDPNLNTTGSFFLRRNETENVPRPEWSNRCSSDPTCAPAGYVMATLPATLTIKASFSCDDTTVPSIHIRALEGPASPTHILGAVQAKLVNLQNGKSGLVVFNLPDAKARMDKVSVSDITWKWQFSTDGINWTDFQDTVHRIYVVLEMPTEPWKPTSSSANDIQVPWTEVLDKACEWAAGAKDVDEAAAGVTRNVYDLGKINKVRYGTAASYARNAFNCTGFLQLLKQGVGNSQRINCEDCATVVSTFSNVLGANLFQSSMNDVFGFTTNPILLIGKQPNQFRAATFLRHQVAWKNNCDVNDRLFDACLQVDGDGRPQAGGGQIALQPTNLVFGTAQQPGSYKFFFSSEPTKPTPTLDRKRRLLGISALGLPIITNNASLNGLKEHYNFNSWPHPDVDPNPVHENDSQSNGSLSDSSPFDFSRLLDAFTDWEQLSVIKFPEESFVDITETLLKRRGSSEEFVEITVYEPAPEQDPNEFLLQLLGHFDLLNFKLSLDVGDVSFASPQGDTVLFRRRNFVAAVRSVGLKETRVIELARDLDLSLPHSK